MVFYNEDLYVSINFILDERMYHILLGYDLVVVALICMNYRHIENISHGLRVAYWNINGLIRKSEDYCKFLDPLFINEVKNVDIISTRSKAPKARKHSGGILILIKNKIAQGIKVVKSNSGGYIWLKLDKTFFNISQYILLWIAYISPENSTYTCTRNSNEDHLALIHNDIMNFEKENLIMIMGDLNARTSNVSDMINNDHDDHLPIGDNCLLDRSIPPRNNQDRLLMIEVYL